MLFDIKISNFNKYLNYILSIFNFYPPLFDNINFDISELRYQCKILTEDWYDRYDSSNVSLQKLKYRYVLKYRIQITEYKYSKLILENPEIFL